MRTGCIRGLIWSTGLGMLIAAAGTARAGSFFVNALSSSPLGTNVFGDFDQSHEVTADAQTFFTNGTDFYSAEGFANANLRTGVLHGLISANYGYDATNPATGDLLGSPFPIGNANFGDSLNFIGSFSNQVVTFHAEVTGTWTNLAGNPSIGGAQFQFMVLPGGTIDQFSGNTFEVFDTTKDTNFLSNNVVDVGPTQSFPVDIDVPVTLNGVNPTIDFAADLNLLGLAVNIGDSFNGDFTHSADISFTGLPGVTVISASGTFPGTVPVPEPSAFCSALIGIGALGLSWIRKANAKRRRINPPAI